MIEVSRFYKEVRTFCEQEPTYSPRRQVVRTLPSDRWDLSRVARRVYKDASEVLTIMAAAGLASVDSELKEQDLVLPTIEHLHLLKERAGIVASVRSVR